MILITSKIQKEFLTVNVAALSPDVVLYGENLNDDVMTKAVNAISNAQVLIIEALHYLMAGSKPD